MKPVFKVLLVIIVVFIGKPLAAQFSAGIILGLNSANLKGNPPTGSTYKSSLGFCGGLLAEYAVKKDVILSLQPMYQKKGTTIAVYPGGKQEAQDSLNVNLHYFSLPLIMKVISGNGKTYVLGGIDFGFLQKATLAPANNGESEKNIDDFIKSIDIAAHFGVGLALPVNVMKLSFEIRYVQGLLNISDEKEDPNRESLPLQFKTTGIMLFSSLSIPIGGKN